MPKGKKRVEAASPVVSDVSDTQPVTAAVATEVSQGTATASEPKRPTAELEEKTPRGQFRSWVSDSGRGYSRLVDNVHNRLVLKFDARPSQDVLAAVKGAGFEFKADYYGQQNVWIRRNDFEGRHRTESIESMVRGVSGGQNLPPG